jgi:uncharacterized protein YjbJ (UPF0337 family)
MDKAKGKGKEAYGALTGDEALKAEGRAEQRKADAEAEARQREKTRRAEEEARQAEKERDRQRLKDKGPLQGTPGRHYGRHRGSGRTYGQTDRPLGGEPRERRRRPRALSVCGVLPGAKASHEEADRSELAFRGLCPGDERQTRAEE